MPNTKQSLPGFKPTLKCLPLPEFEAQDLDVVLPQFQQATPRRLGQSWLEKEESDFAPAFVRTGWRGTSLLIFAELNDHDIFTGVTAANQRAWELGDTFEMFLRPAGQEAYYEFHVTPNNQRLQLRFANADALAHTKNTGSIESVLIQKDAFSSVTWLRPESQRWYVYAEIKAAELGETVESLQDSQWQFSFSRYDYTRGRKEPVISSTSPHPHADFHRQQDWGVITFEPL